MAKEENKKQLNHENKINNSKDTKKKKKSKRDAKNSLILVLVLLLGIIVIYYNRNSINSFLANSLKQVPVLNKVFKISDDPYKNQSKNMLANSLKAKEVEIEGLNKTIEELRKDKQTLEENTKKLKEYEKNYNAFVKQKEEWDESIAKSNPDLFISQFEKIYPSEANEIYKELKSNEIMTKDQKDYAKVVGQMDEEAAARSLELLLETDPELVGIIFDGMDAERKALILSAMTPEASSKVIKLTYPKADNE